MVFFFKVCSLLHDVAKNLQVLVLHIKHLQCVHLFLEHPTEHLEIPLILWRQQSKTSPRLPNSGRPARPMDVDFSVEGALVVDDILHVGDVKAAGGHVCADKNGAFSVVVDHRG